MTLAEPDDFREYVAEQITDYIQSHTVSCNYVTPEKMKALEKGVTNICMAAYPEYQKGWAANASKIIRNGLDMSQLSMADKMQKILDKASSPKEEIIADILNNIIHLKANPAKANIDNANIEKENWVHNVSRQKTKIGVNQNAR